MKVDLAHGPRNTLRGHSAQAGFTLVEVIGVLAVGAVLAAVMIPLAMAQFKATLRKTEISNLQTLAQGFKQHVLRTKTIPDHTTWVQAVAAESGWAAGDVVTNLNQNPRVLLIDPALRLGTDEGRLPYTQPPAGSLIRPVSPLLMILSTMRRGLPVSNGVAVSTTVFNDIWTIRDGEVPPGWPAEWTGKGEELIVQRINLAPLFNLVILQNFYAPDQALYSVEDSGNIPVVGLEGAAGYYIQGTLFTFHDTHSLSEAAGPSLDRPLSPPTSLLDDNTSAPDVLQIVQEDSVFNYEQNRWIAQNLEGRRISTLDQEMAANLFLDVRNNPNARANATPATVVNAMLNYLDLYAQWAGASFPTVGALYQSLLNAQKALGDTTSDLAGIPTGKKGP